MRLDLVHAHRLERAVADVQRDGRRARRRRASIAATSAVVEVQAGGRRRDRSARARRTRSDSARDPPRVSAPLDVGRQRHVADGIDQRVDRPCPSCSGPLQPDRAGGRRTAARAPPPSARRPPPSNRPCAPGFSFWPGCMSACQISEVGGRRSEVGGRRSEVGGRRSGSGSREQQTLDRAAARDTMAEQPRRKDAGVVGDEKIAGSKEGRQMREPWRASWQHGRAIEHQKSRLAPRGGLLRDQLFRKIEIKRVDFHPSPTSSLRPRSPTD